MREWAARMVHRKAFVNPQFRSRYHDQRASRWIMLWDGEDRLLGTMAWRIADSADVVADLESGRLLYADPPSAGWRPIDTGLAGRVVLAGRIASRGGIHAFVKGQRLAWWMTTFAMAHSVDQACDFNVGVAFEDVADAGLPQRFYGYGNANRCRPAELPTVAGADGTARVEALTLVWADRTQVLEELERRARFLQTAHGEDLRSIALAYERDQHP